MIKKYTTIFISLCILTCFSCSMDTLQKGFLKNPSNQIKPIPENYEFEVDLLTANQSLSNTNVTLNWVNPKDGNFEKIIILRNLTNYPKSVLDQSSDLIFSGLSETFIDNELTQNISYYYKIFVKSKDNRYSKGLNISKKIIPIGNIDYTYNKNIENLTIIQNPDTNSLSLNWINPIDANFDKVVILRKIDSFPSGVADAFSQLVYSGTSQSFIDYNLTVGKKYCYIIVAKSIDNKYSSGVYQAKEIIPSSSIYNSNINSFSIVSGEPNTTAILNWQNPTDADFNSVTIMRKQNSFPSGITDQSADLVYTGNLQTITDYDVTINNKYFYAIYTKNKNNLYSTGVYQTYEVLDSNNVYDENASNVTITQSPGTTNIQLDWTNTTDTDFSKVVILRKEANFPSGVLDSTATIVYTGTGTTFTDKALTVGTKYCYIVYSKNKSNLYSTGIYQAIDVIDVSSIYSKNASNVTITQSTSNTNIQLNWTNTTDTDFSKVVILRKETNFPSGVLDSTATIVYTGTGTTFTDMALTAGTKYCYVIYSKNISSLYSTGVYQAINVIDVSSIYSENVSNVTITQSTSNTNIQLDWTNTTDTDFSKVVILRKEANFPSGVLDSTATIVYTGTGTTFTDMALTVGTKYCYIIYSKNKSNLYSTGIYQAIDVIDVSSIYSKNASNVTIIQSPGNTNIQLDWTNTTDTDFSKVVILRKEANFPSGVLDSTATIVYTGTGITFTDTALTVGTKYCYIIYSKNISNLFSTGIYVSEKIVSVGDVLYENDVTDFITLEGRNNREINISWINPIDSNLVSVKLLKSTTNFPTGYNDGAATELYVGTNESFVDSNLLPDTTYYYGIYTLNNNGFYSYGQKSFRNIPAETGSTDVNVRKRSFFLIGGSSSYPANPYTNFVADVDMYDPLTNTLYSNVATLPTPRAFCDVASVKGKIYIFGGYSAVGTITNVVDILDAETLVWTTGLNMPVLRAGLRTVTWKDKIYTIGGTSTAISGGALIDGRRYDPILDTWLADTNNIFKDILTARTFAGVTINNGTIFYFGGTNTAGTAIPAGAGYGYSYNILTNTETAAPSYSTALTGRTSISYHKFLDDGKEINYVFHVGGGTAGAISTAIPHANLTYATNVVNVMELPSYGGVPNWVVIAGDGASLNTNRVYASGESYGDYIYIFGGVNGSALTSIEKFNVNDGDFTSAWQSSGFLATARYGFGITKVNY